jgi:prepilin-type N-terminal cleavage/methylation domain-containing protein/prepilin-type processing-associated H-X9-DG protein
MNKLLKQATTRSALLSLGISSRNEPDFEQKRQSDQGIRLRLISLFNYHKNPAPTFTSSIPLQAQRFQRQGFTLIELLVVIAIIGVISAMIGLVVGRVKSNGLKTKSMSNMRAIGIALNTYCGDRNGDFPRSAHTSEEDSWVFSLAPYLQNLDEVRICPADPLAKERLKAGKTTSYSLNEYICVPSMDRFGRVKEDFTNRLRLPNQSQTIAAFLGADGLDLGVSNDHTHSRNWKTWQAVLSDIQPDRFRTGRPVMDRTEGEAHYLFADGHVETLSAKWLKSEIEAGRNPAIPPL